MGRAIILVIEDDSNISCFLAEILASFGYKGVIAASGTEALQIVAAEPPSLILLDLGLPDMDGLEVIKQVKSKSNIPIIVVSARDHGMDKVIALDMGADDYVTKPFDTQELLARIRTALRHYNSEKDELASGNSASYRCGDLCINFGGHRVDISGTIVHLTQNEYKILELLSKNAGKVMTHKAIMEAIWGRYDEGDNKILRVNMANIRRKLKNDKDEQYFYTETGVGYRMPESDD